MLKKIIVLSLMPAWAWANCVLTDQTAVTSQAKIERRSGITVNVVAAPGLAGYRRCEVTFHAQIGDRWYLTSGHHDWPGDRPQAEACAIAQTRADHVARTMAGTSQITTHQTMICTDNSNAQPMTDAQIGQQAELHQFRPHPQFPRAFWHNGAQCRWFIEPQFRDRDIHNHQGVICELRRSVWVVVDKF